MRFFFNLLLISAILGSCTLDKNKNDNALWKETVDKNISKLLGKPLILPKAIKISNLNSVTSNQGLQIKDYTIVTYVDATCGSCLKDLVFWNEFLSELKLKKISCEFKMYVYSNDYEEFERTTAKDLKLIYPWIQDSKAEFPTLNRIPDKMFQTALLDKNNEVVLLGSPVLKISLKELYIQTLTKIAQDQLK